MATWLVGHTPWLLPVRARLRLEVLPSRLWLQARTHLNTALQTPSPASLEIEEMPYPTEHPDITVFEPMSEEYASVSTPGPNHFTPRSSSETLASLVLKGDFQTAEMLRNEMISHHIHITRDAVYLRAALHVIKEYRPGKSVRQRLGAFEAWFSLIPNIHEERLSFHVIRQRIFLSMGHLNVTLVYRFGLSLASKGYHHGHEATQVVSTLARYAPVSVVGNYLRDLEDAYRNYHSKEGAIPPSHSLASVYNTAIRTVALGGKDEAAFDLISMAQSRGVYVYEITLTIVAKHAPDEQMMIDRIQALYPSWTLLDPNTRPIRAEHKTIPAGRSADTAVLAARLRSLRSALRSPAQPSPHALRNFITSYQALGRTRALTLLRSLAYRHSHKSASTWAFTEMLHHRLQQEHFHVLFVFSRHFHLVGVPQKTLLSLTMGMRGQKARKEPVQRWVASTCPLSKKLWPSAYHTALVWEAIVSLLPMAEHERLYTVLLSLVRDSKQQERGCDEPSPRQVRRVNRAKLRLPPNTYDAAHFSPFVSLWTLKNPAKAAGILRDMVHLGVEPSMVQWSMLAWGYTQCDNPRVALRILDRLEDVERGKKDNTENGDNAAKRQSPSDMLLGVHTNVLRGFVMAGDMQHAREVERRLMVRLGYRTGDRQATDTSIARLRALEAKLASSRSRSGPADVKSLV